MGNNATIELYTELATNPEKDFGWEKGKQNAIKHGYRKEWLTSIPEPVWKYCAAVGNAFEAGEFHKGDTILDIGCGAGVDLCVASLLTGETGKVFGVDITPKMVEKAKENAQLTGLSNIFVNECDIEKLPFEDQSMDIVISNGAINLSTSKQQVFSEIYRVLVNGGHLYFSDMIKENKNSPADTGEARSCDTQSWADCVAGTLKSDELIGLMTDAGFNDAELLSTNHYKTSDSTVGATFRASRT